MRIVFVAYDGPSYLAGPIVNLRRLLPELKRRGHQPVALIIYRRNEAPSAQILQAEGVECRLLPWQPYSETMVRWLLNQLDELNPDIFVPNISVQGYYAGRTMKEAGIPTIGTMRSNDAFHWGVVDEFVSGSSEWAMSGLVCVNEELRQDVESRNPKHTRLCVIPSGVPVPIHVSKHEGPLRLAYVGRLTQEAKRIFEVVEALCRALTELPSASATVFGDGVERPRLEALVKEKGLNNRIEFAGPVASEDIQRRLAEHHVIVLLSDYEGTPGAIMDGMACGLVPVCSDIPGGVRQLVLHEHTGLLVTDRDQSFLDAIQRLAHDPALRVRLGANARQHVIENYSLDIAVDRWESFCAKLLADAGPRQAIRIPRKFHLPPVHPGLAREDKREPPRHTQVIQCSRSLAGRLKRRFLRTK